MKRLTEVLATPAIPLGIVGVAIAGVLSLGTAAPALADPCGAGFNAGPNGVSFGVGCDNGPGPGWNNGPGPGHGGPPPRPIGWPGGGGPGPSWNNGPGPWQGGPPPVPVDWNFGTPPPRNIFGPTFCGLNGQPWDAPHGGMKFTDGIDGVCRWYDEP